MLVNVCLSNLLDLLEVGILDVVGIVLAGGTGLLTALEACATGVEACTWVGGTGTRLCTCGVHLLAGSLHLLVEGVDGIVNLGDITAVLGLLQVFPRRKSTV